MKQGNTVLLAIFIFAMIFSFGVNTSFTQVTDKDGNIYKTVTIGTQEWMAENLNVEHYRNGDVIPQVQDAYKWSELTTGAWCYYENDSENGKTYGKLYNWYAVNDSRGLAPEGWHIPTDEEWHTLVDTVEELAGGKLKATTLWESPNTGATNESGFSAFPGGFRKFDGDFYMIGEDGSFWSASEFNLTNAWVRSLSYEYAALFRNDSYKRSGKSVRCVRD